MKFKKALAMAGLVTILTAGTSVVAQPGGGGQGGGGFGGGQGGGFGGNFDPAQFAQMQLQRYQEQLQVTDDNEWKALSPKVQAVIDARSAIPRSGGRGGRGGGMGGGPGGMGGGPGGMGGGMPGMPGATNTSPTLTALQAAVEAKAAAPEIKTKLEAYRAEVKTKQAALDKAQDDLKKLLTAQQEALAVIAGLLN